jgi:hypothetical protein
MQPAYCAKLIAKQDLRTSSALNTPLLHQYSLQVGTSSKFEILKPHAGACPFKKQPN